jgi:hypothetical protein
VRSISDPWTRVIAGLGFLAAVAATNASAQSILGTPGTLGDQILFLYDARAPRVPFLSVTNPSDDTVLVEVAFYPLGLGSRLATVDLTLVPAGNEIIDPTQVDGGALVGQAGLAVVTPIDGTADRRPIVPPQPLAGSFTLANLDLSAAFGESGLGRLAVTAAGARAAAGSTVDGNAVRYQRFAPSTMLVPVYFNPTQLAPPDLDGNRVLLASFSDRYGPPFAVDARAIELEASFFDASGVLVARETVAVNGVRLDNLQGLSGAVALSSSGKVFFAGDPGSGNVAGLFSQSLGTFASGQRLPGGDLPVPAGNAPPLATPTPTPVGPAPNITPPAGFSIPQTSCRDGMLDVGEQCDDGVSNLEFFLPGAPPGLDQRCLFCAQTYELGFPIENCLGDDLFAFNPHRGDVCGDDALGSPNGSPLPCRVNVGGSSFGGCRPIADGNSSDILEYFRLRCGSFLCVPPETARGGCLVSGAACSLTIDGSPAAGTCEENEFTGALVCQTSVLPFL